MSSVHGARQYLCCPPTYEANRLCNIQDAAFVAMRQEVPVRWLQRRACQDNPDRFTAAMVLSCRVHCACSDACYLLVKSQEPRQAIIVSQRVALLHLGFVACWMKVISI